VIILLLHSDYFHSRARENRSIFLALNSRQLKKVEEQQTI
jgi:hypothetical protein